MVRKNGRSGFSLVELLVVMAIISVLAGLTMPVYHKYRSAAYGVKCVANLKGIGYALTQYQGTWSGWFPYALDTNVEQTDKKGKAVTWKYELSFYMGNHSVESYRKKSYPLHPAFFDPIKGKGKGNYFISAAHFGESVWLKTMMPTKPGQTKPDVGWVPYSEWRDKWIAGGPNGELRLDKRMATYPKGYIPYASWRAPETAAIITESVDPKMQRGYAYDAKKKVPNVEYRHNGTANVLFLDCHVRDFNEGDKSLYANPSGKTPIPGGCFDKKVLESINLWQEPPVLKETKWSP